MCFGVFSLIEKGDKLRMVTTCGHHAKHLINFVMA